MDNAAVNRLRHLRQQQQKERAWAEKQRDYDRIKALKAIPRGDTNEPG